MSIQHWTRLEAPEQIQQIQQESAAQPVIIYKHSTRCGVSSAVLNRLERSASTFKGAKLYFLDLLKFRLLSNLVAEKFSVPHESPQLLLIANGQVVLDLSHFDIEPAQVGAALLKVEGDFLVDGVSQA